MQIKSLYSVKYSVSNVHFQTATETVKSELTSYILCNTSLHFTILMVFRVAIRTSDNCGQENYFLMNCFEFYEK